MTGPLHGSFSVLDNVRLAERTFLLRLHSPDLAQRMRPGQFVMLRLPGRTDPLLGRPFALYDTLLTATGDPSGIAIVYLVVGKMTNQLAELQPGDLLEVWGPLGQPFPVLQSATVKHLGLVAGGIGQTPFLAYAREVLGDRGYGGICPQRQVERVTLFYGVRSADLAACVEDFRALGVTVYLASDDGTLGRCGRVTELLQEHGSPDHLVGCGPEPMLHALARLAATWGTPCHVSLETPMACGIGVCFSCVTRVKTPDHPGGWDYRRVCMEGPVFDARTLVWEDN